MSWMIRLFLLEKGAKGGGKRGVGEEEMLRC